MSRYFGPSRSYLAGLFSTTRRNLGFLTEQEANAAYLNDAVDRFDLEYRMRQLDKPRRPYAANLTGQWDY